jgi:hypothetical protein
MKAKVWVTQEARHDFLPAQEFGDIEFLTNSELSSVKNSLNNKRIADELRFKLQKFDPEHDYLCHAGSPYVFGLACFWLGLRGVTKLNILRWSSRDARYVPIYLDLRTENVNVVRA